MKAIDLLAAAGLSEKVHALVGGTDVRGTGGLIEVLDPASAEVVATFADADRALVGDAVRAASEGFGVWSGFDGAARAKVLHALAGLIRRQAGPLAALESLDSGKPLNQAAGDVETAARYFEFYAGVADKLYGESMEQPNGFAYTRREPFGVVGVITPWNSPISQMARSVAPAMAAGNAVVVKPSELTPLTTLVMARLALEVGVPAGAFNVVLGSGRIAGSALVEHPDVGYLSFTGSIETGRSVARAAGDRIVGVSLELGGKSATLVLPDADLAAAAQAGVAAVVRNAGQSCFATTRLVVHRSVHDELVERMIGGFDALTVGPGLNSPDLGPLVSEAQRLRAIGFVERAVTAGATIANDVSGELPERGYFLRPHLLTGVTNGMELARCEVFGPVQAVIVVDDDEEAIAVANDSDYGLAAGIFTSSLTKAHRYAHRLQAGQVQVNRYPAGGVDTPFGGYKKSGLGREKGIEALRHYQQLKTVIIDLGADDAR
ncbi:aldehyde dehydrogenase family protein [Streptomyces sp. NPDC055722]